MANLIEIVIQARDDATNNIKNVSLSLDGIGESLQRTGVQLTAITAPLAGFFASALKQASDQQTVMAQLEATLKSTGAVAGVTAEQALDLSDSLARVTRFGDDAILSAENLLLTFTSIGKDIFPEATRVVLDMSTALGQDLKSSAMQLGKALNDPISGLTALRRVGVQFTDAQQEAIEAMVTSGDLMGAQRAILAELTKEFGGSAEAAGTTFAGKLDILNNRFGELQEKIGFIVMPVLEKAIDLIGGVVEAVTQWTDEHPELTRVLTMFAGGLVVLGPLLIGVGTAMRAISALKLGSIFLSILNPVKLLGVALGVLTSPITLVIGGLALLATALGVDILGGLQAVVEQVGFFVNALGEQGLGGAIRQFFTTFEDGSSRLSTIFEGFGMAREQAQAFADTINNVVQGIAAALSGDLSAALKNFFEAGMDPQTAVRIADVFMRIQIAVGQFVQLLRRLPDEFSLLVFYAQYHFGKIKAAFETYVVQPLRGLWSIIEPFWNELVDWYETNLRPELEKVPGWVQTNIVAPLQDIWGQIQPVIQQVIGFIEQILAPVFDAIQDLFAQIEAGYNILRQLGGGQSSIAGAVATGMKFGPATSQNSPSRSPFLGNNVFGYAPGSLSALDGNPYAAAYNSRSFANLPFAPRDFGGRGYPGMPVSIGVGAQPEVYIPDSAGSFYPRGEGLGGGSVTVEPGGIVIYESNNPQATKQAVIDAIVEISQRGAPANG